MSRSSVANTKDRPADRRKMVLYSTLAVVVIAIVVAVGLASRQVVPQAASQAPIESKLKPGDPAPSFSVQTNAGPFDLATVSTPVLLEVFATWCPHCQRETSVLNDVTHKYAGKVAVVAVSGSPQGIDGNSPESQADVSAFGERFHTSYPIAFDPQLKVAQEYLKSGYPTLALITPQKTVAWIASGEVAEGTIAGQIDKVLK